MSQVGRSEMCRKGTDSGLLGERVWEMGQGEKVDKFEVFGFSHRSGEGVVV